MHEQTSKGKLPEERPREVNLALKLLLTSLATGALGGYLRPISLPENVPQIASFEILVLILLFNGYIYYSLFLRRNWARIFFLVLTLAGLPLSIPKWPATILSNPLPGSVDIITTLIQLVAAYLLLKKSSKNWFVMRGGKK